MHAAAVTAHSLRWLNASCWCCTRSSVAPIRCNQAWTRRGCAPAPAPARPSPAPRLVIPFSKDVASCSCPAQQRSAPSANAVGGDEVGLHGPAPAVPLHRGLDRGQRIGGLTNNRSCPSPRPQLTTTTPTARGMAGFAGFRTIRRLFSSQRRLPYTRGGSCSVRLLLLLEEQPGLRCLALVLPCRSHPLTPTRITPTSPSSKLAVLPNGDPDEMVRAAQMICNHTADGASVDDMAITLHRGSVMHNGG